MTFVLFLLAVGMGIVIGAQIGAVLLELQGASARGQRLAAVREAEDRVRAVQAAALHDLADVAVQVIDIEPAGQSAGWPSQRAGGVPETRPHR